MGSSTRLFMIAIPSAMMMSMEPPAATKEVFQVRDELYAPSRLPAKVYELQRTRALATDVIAQQCWLMVLAITKTHELLGNALPRIGILGGGHMGCAVTMTLLKNKYPPDRIVISTRQPDRVPKCEALANPNNASLFNAVSRCYDNTRLSKESEILILCMPPSQLKSVAIQIKHAMGIAQSSCVVISGLCGIAIETIQKACGTKLVTRTQIHVQELNSLVITADKDDDDDENPESTSAASSGVLERLQQDALSIAAQHLVRTDTLMATPLAHALRELACRLSRPGASQAPETVATVLCGDCEVSRQEDPIDNTTHRADDPYPVVRPAQAEAPGSDADVEADATDPQPAPPPMESWLPEWTQTLQQLQRHSKGALQMGG